MKKIFTILGIATFAVAVSAQTTVASDNFTYTGALNANGWVTHSGTAAQLTSDGNSASLNAGNSEDVNLAFSTVYAISATGVSKADYSATINIASATGLTTAGDYFLMFGGAAGTTVTTLYSRLYVKGSATGYTLGILNNSGGTATPAYGTEIPYGTPANITVTYTIDNSVATPTNTATLQINSQALLSNATGTGGIPSNLASVAIREAGNATSGTGNISIDNLLVRTYTATLAVTDLSTAQNNFVKNTAVNDEINFSTKADVKVFSMNGQVVKSSTVSENKNLDVADLAPGMYIVTGIVDGQAVSTKVMKK